MSNTEMKYTKGQIDAAGIILIDPREDFEKYDQALQIINYWRALHSFPLNTFQKTLRRKAKLVDPQSLVAQRIKRLSSIDAKLSRFSPQMKLSQMQDIGGCRAVVSSVSEVEKLVEIYEKSDIKHKVGRKDNYISKPKDSGYRGIHVVYRYFSDRRKTFNGLKVEMQFRSQLQHAWATSVETVGTFTKQALKSSRGEADWLRFFALMSSEIAYREDRPLVPNTPSNRVERTNELHEYVEKLDVINRLHTFGRALTTLGPVNSSQNAHYFLLVLNPEANSVTVTSYKYHELEKASVDYLAAERSIGQTNTDAVLVSVESMESLRRAYPNYFLDTAVFIKMVEEAINQY